MSVAHASGRRVILRDSGLGYASLAALTLLGMATKVLLARALSPVELGMLLSGQAIVALALTVAQLNLPDAVARFVGLYSDDMPRAKGVLRSALLTVSVSACVVAGVVMLGAWPISVGIYGERRLLGVLMVLAVGIPFAATANVLGAAYRGVGALWVKIVYLDLVPALWLVLALSVMVALHATSLWIAALIYLGATLVAVTCVSVWFGVGGRWRTVATGNPTGELLRYGVPLLGAWLVAWPLAAIPLLLGAFGSMQSVAFYGLALSLAALVYTGVGAAGTAALPVW